MKKVNVDEVEERTRQSPKGKFCRFVKDISVALGSDDESLDLEKRHAFEMSLVRVPKGKSMCPYHSHSTSSEFYLVVSGCGSIRDKDGITTVRAGDAFFFGPSEAHQLTNAGEDDFVFYVVADSPRSDSCYYPDSGKFYVCKESGNWVLVKEEVEEVNYFDGEE